MHSSAYINRYAMSLSEYDKRASTDLRRGHIGQGAIRLRFSPI